ncbi:CPBP family intramembrane glutamic endopeptidase [Hazenella coriacea]|uniref:CAAX prenyl protease-like protein n=1 Tax=Hazenella coriacea TaxID=1179467 RepID=A0A4R3L0F5_9BACL|nr:type II CAAX endopeptidase family protein [Hazenella coriacea]TCS92826.1 CAAX prenyl protease-like protein [Hazenella coriacea]
MTQITLSTTHSLSVQQPKNRFHQLRDLSAWVLFIIHLAQRLINFGLFEWTKTDQNTWLIQFTDYLPLWYSVTFSFMDLLSLAATLSFLLFGFLTLFSYEAHLQPYLSLKDLVYYLAWNQIIYLVFFYLLSVLNVISIDPYIINTFFQFFIDISYLVTAIALFWGRFSVIGFRIQIPFRWLWFLLPLFTISGYFFIYFIVDGVITEAVSQLFSLDLGSERMNSIEEDIQHSIEKGWAYILVQWLCIGVIGPINEEILYRGFYQQLFTKRWGALIGILIPSFIFALDHVDIPLFAPLFISGIVFAIFRHLYQSLWAPILLHMVLNTTFLVFDILNYW